MSRYLLSTSIASLFSWASFLVVLIQIDPYVSTRLALSLFFTTLFFSLTSTFTIIGCYIRRRISNNEIVYNHLRVTVRQSILLSIITLGCLLFLLFDLLTWWDGLLLVAIISLIEFYFSSNE